MGGILSPARYDDSGQKTGIDVLDVTTGQRRALAIVTCNPQETTVGEYQFHGQAMRWALERVLSALAAPLDVVIVDEIGPLELRHEEGFAPALDRLSTSCAHVAVLIVRSSLVLQVQKKLAVLHPARIGLSRDNRDDIPTRLYETVCNMLADPKD
jgi:nucleoside-triphosphatase THEP1